MQDKYNPTSDIFNRGLNAETTNSRSSMEHVQDMHETDLSKLPVLQTPDSVCGELAGSMVDPETEIKALEAVRIFAQKLSVLEDDVKPCMAYIYEYGSDSQRRPYAFALALYLHFLGKSQAEIKKALEYFNTRLNKSLSQKEIISALKSASSGKYDKQYRCDNQLLAAYCIGEICPWKKPREKGSKKPVISSLIASPWFPILTPFAFKILCGLHRLRMLKGYPVNSRLVFSYSQLEKITGIKRRNFTKHLEELGWYGLITEFSPGTGWGTGSKGSGSSLRFTWPLPQPSISNDTTLSI